MTKIPFYSAITILIVASASPLMSQQMAEPGAACHASFNHSVIFLQQTCHASEILAA
ncbi:MAG TPA: hypothetical protein PK580_03295 [Nitrosomonas halophila]|nr:hypothetical protein [Nitrosomonas halophila]